MAPTEAILSEILFFCEAKALSGKKNDILEN